MILRWQLEHKMNGKWEETPHSIKLEIPSGVYHLLKFGEMSAAFEGVLEILACRDQSINFEEVRVLLYGQPDS